MTPLVSIVTGTFNRASLLRRAIKSVLGQTYSNLEYWVSSDGSTDETPDVIREFNDPRLHFIDEGKSSYYTVNRNRGVKRSTGETICFLDDDNWWEPNFIEEHMKVHKSPDVAITYSGRVIHEGDDIMLTQFIKYNGQTEYLNGLVDVGDLMFKRELFKGFSEEKDRIGYCSDLQAIDQVMEGNPQMKMVLIPKYLHHYLSTENNMTHRKLADRAKGEYNEEEQWKM